MTHPTDYFPHPQPQSGQGVHTQESGDAGLSSNMEHRFSDYYRESSGSVADKGSFVTPFTEDEPASFYHSMMEKKIWSQPSVRKHGAGPKTHPVCAEEGLIKPLYQAVVQKPNFLPQDWSERCAEEDAVMVLPGKATILERQPDAEVAREGGCNKMDTWVNPAKPKGPPLGPGGRRKGNQRRKRAAGKHWKLYLQCWMALTCISVSGGFPAKCYTCMDKDRCPKLLTIYETKTDILLFRRDDNESLPDCSVTSPPGPKSCAVCRDQSNITISCSEDVEKVDVEDSEGQIEDIFPVFSETATESGGAAAPPLSVAVSETEGTETATESGGAAGPSPPPVNVTEDMRKGVQEQIPGRARVGLIVSVVAFLIVVGALVICSCCHKKTRDRERSSEEL